MTNQPKPRQPKPPAITVRLGRASLTLPAELLPALAELGPVARQAGNALGRVRATIERDTPNG